MPGLRMMWLAIGPGLRTPSSSGASAWRPWVFERLENPQGNRGSDVLAIFALKKAWPAKYDDKPPVVNIDARSISAELAQIGRRLQTSEQKPSLEAPGGGAGLSESGYEG